MTVIIINQDEHYSINDAITYTLYEKYGCGDWEILETVGSVVYGELINGIKFNYWTENEELFLEV